MSTDRPNLTRRVRWSAILRERGCSSRSNRPPDSVTESYAITQWALWRQPPRVVLAVLISVIGALSVMLVSLSHPTLTPASWLRGLLVVALGAGFEEVSRTIERLRIHLVDVGHANMLSVWLFAGATALPMGQALVVCVLLSLHRSARQPRPLGSPSFRRAYSTAAALLATAAASATCHAFPLHASTLAALTGVFLGAAALSLTGRVLVFGIIALADRSFDLRMMVGHASDYSLEVATLCLGGLTGLAVAVEPPLAILVLLPAYVVQRAALVRELEIAASHDAKTGLLNAVSWRTLAERELSRSEREQRPASVFIVDLDHFKVVNDSWGHAAGDAAIKAVGQCMRDELRNYDSIGRFGGEEFVAMLPDVDQSRAAVIAERLRSRVAEMDIPSIAGSTLNAERAANYIETLSTSVGVACFPAHGQDLDQLLIAADSALYRAKQGGRNRVEFADAPGPLSPELVSD